MPQCLGSRSSLLYATGNSVAQRTIRLHFPETNMSNWSLQRESHFWLNFQHVLIRKRLYSLSVKAAYQNSYLKQLLGCKLIMVAKKYKEQQSLYKYRPFPRRRLLFVSHMRVKDDCNFKFDRSDRSNLIGSFVFFLSIFQPFMALFIRHLGEMTRNGVRTTYQT